LFAARFPFSRDGHEAVRLTALFARNLRGRGGVSHHEVLMQQRIDVTKVSPAAFQAVAALQSYVDQSGLDPKLRELIKIRASQINGCAYCLAMHTRDARKHGETDERMHLLNVWREAPLYTARERAALAWVEAITLLTEGHVPDDVFETVCKQFSEREIVDLTAAAVAINTWNRLSIAFRVPPQVDTKKAAA
jgi:AhpD family alkylhydroperoxidase